LRDPHAAPALHRRAGDVAQESRERMRHLSHSVWCIAVNLARSIDQNRGGCPASRVLTCATGCGGQVGSGASVCTRPSHHGGLAFPARCAAVDGGEQQQRVFGRFSERSMNMRACSAAALVSGAAGPLTWMSGVMSAAWSLICSPRSATVLRADGRSDLGHFSGCAEPVEPRQARDQATRLHRRCWAAVGTKLDVISQANPQRRSSGPFGHH
jgi:hypothetical protein